MLSLNYNGVACSNVPYVTQKHLLSDWKNAFYAIGAAIMIPIVIIGGILYYLFKGIIYTTVICIRYYLCFKIYLFKSF